VTDIPLEASPEDVLEQRAEAGPGGRATTPPSAVDLPLEADPADVADQLAEVPLDDDRY
jgi:transcriptional regulatory protein LevR